jgi:tight adherence protein B
MIFVVLGLVIGVILLFAGLVLSRRGGRQIEDRLDQYVGRGGPAEDKEGPKDKGPSILARGAERLARPGYAQRMATELARANLKITVGEFMILTLLSVLGTGVIVFIVWSNIFFGIAGAVLGFFLPRWYIGFRQGQRLKQFNDQLGDAINLLANGLRSGYSLLQAMDALAKEMPPPIAEEFRRVVQEISLGLSNEQAMNNLLRRIPSDDLDLMITAINVQHEVGGNLSEILETIGFTIRERVRIKGEIKVLTAQGMISGYVISFLPVGLGAVLYLMNPDYIGSMFKETCGIIMLVIGGIMIGSGFFAIRRIVNIEV